MEELKKKISDKIENVKQVSIEKQTAFIGTLKPKKGHKLFEVNYKLNIIMDAVFDELPAVKFEDAKNGLKSVSKKITKKQDCIYISALNKKNAIKKLKRDFNININI